MVKSRLQPNNCPILEKTADGDLVGRCFFFCRDDVCPRHGDVKDAFEKYRETGQLTFERDHVR